MFCSSGGVYRSALAEATATPTSVQACVRQCVKAWNIDCGCSFIFFRSSSAHWPLCNYLWDDWECYLNPWHSDLVYLGSECYNWSTRANYRPRAPLEGNIEDFFFFLELTATTCTYMRSSPALRLFVFISPPSVFFDAYLSSHHQGFHCVRRPSVHLSIIRAPVCNYDSYILNYSFLFPIH